MPIFGSVKWWMVRRRKSSGRNEVGVKDGDKLAFRRLHALRQRACLEAFAIAAVMIRNRKTARSIAFDQARATA